MPLFLGTFECRLPTYRPLYMPMALVQQFTNKQAVPPGGVKVYVAPGKQPRTLSIYPAEGDQPKPEEASDAKITRAGLRLPYELSDLLELDGDEVICIGAGDHVEIWPPDLWEWQQSQRALEPF